MASPRTSRPINRGFTLTEILVVVGLLVIVGSFTIAVGMSDFRVSALDNEQKTLIAVLQKARAEALNNIDQDQHGVAIYPSLNPGSYVIFEGASYAAANHAMDEVVDSVYPVALSPSSPTEIVFEQLSGATAYTGDITLVDSARGGISRVIVINREGRISW